MICILCLEDNTEQGVHENKLGIVIIVHLAFYLSLQGFPPPPRSILSFLALHSSLEKKGLCLRRSQPICFKIQGKMPNSLPSWGLAASDKDEER